MHRFIRGTFTRADSQSLERVTHTRSICSTRSNAYEAYQAVFCVIGDGHECVLIPVDIHRRRHLQSMNFQKPLRLKVIAHFSRHYSRSNGDWLAFCAPNLSYPDASRTHLCYVCCGTVRGGARAEYFIASYRWFDVSMTASSVCLLFQAANDYYRTKLSSAVCSRHNCHSLHNHSQKS